MRLRVLAIVGLMVLTLASGPAMAATSEASVSTHVATSRFGLRQRLALVEERLELFFPLPEQVRARLRLELASGELQHAAVLMMQGHSAEAASVESKAALNLSRARRYGDSITAQATLLEHLLTALPAHARSSVQEVMDAHLGILFASSTRASGQSATAQGIRVHGKSQLSIGL